MHISPERRKRLLTIALIILIAIPIVMLIPRYLRGPYIPALVKTRAPDGNWTSSTWAPANNTMLGTATSTTSTVWFTGHNGVVSTVFYPTADMPNSTLLEFLVGNSAHTWVNEEQYDTVAKTQLYDNHSLAWVTTNTAKNNTYQIKKIIYTDPTRNSLIQQVTFTALKGSLADYLLYVYYHPAMHDAGDINYGFTQTYDGRTMLVSTDASGDYASALAASLPFQQDMVSSGFYKFNDGLTDLIGTTNCGNDKCPDYTMNYGYTSASRGNIAQMGLLDLSNDGEVDLTTSNSITFKLVLSFGQNIDHVKANIHAEQTLDATLNDDSDLLKDYTAQWNSFDASLKPPPALGPKRSIQQARKQEYYLAANVLKASQDKTTGAFVAGLGTPWGESNGDSDTNGYHMVILHDLYEIASALIVAGDSADPQRALLWAFNNAQQADGHFPHMLDLSDTPPNNVRDPGILMDEQAYPIMLAWKLQLTDYTDYVEHIKPAADYIVAHGPTTPEDRWGENGVGGYSPATIADEISALVCAADIANANGDTASQQRYLTTADNYEQNVIKWTYTTNGQLGNGHYFLRLTPNGNPNNGDTITLANNGGTYDERNVVDMSFLELVLQGILPADSPYITSSLTAVDTTIGQVVNGYHYWHRYSYDAYGEHQDGSDFDDTGIGRLWPLLTGERGLYTVAANGDADGYLSAMLAAANTSGMIPEQIWDNNAPAGYTPGTPTKSMNPDNWSMAEYIMLLFSMSQHKVVDMIPLTYERYAAHPNAGTTKTPGKSNQKQKSATNVH
jgi:glucoamylase